MITEFAPWPNIFPPFEPTATQFDADTHDTPEYVSTLGTVRIVQDVPPLVVLITIPAVSP